jgi:hypothetical protein
MGYEEKLNEWVAEKFEINESDILDVRTDTWMGGYCETCEYNTGGIIFETTKDVDISDWRLDKQKYYRGRNIYRYEIEFDALLKELI